VGVGVMPRFSKTKQASSLWCTWLVDFDWLVVTVRQGGEEEQCLPAAAQKRRAEAFMPTWWDGSQAFSPSTPFETFSTSV
jgi:hypothetical protein